MKTLVWICILASVVNRSSQDRPPIASSHVGRNRDSLVLNEFIDSVMREIRQSPLLTEMFSPLKLERNITFARGLLYDISVNGLLSLHRQGDITFVPNALEMTARLAVNQIDLSFRYKMRTFGLPSQGNLRVSVENMAMTLKASLRDRRTQLDTFEITYFGKIRISEFAGTSRLLNWLSRPTLEFVLNASRSKLKRRIQSILREKLEEEFRQVHLESLIADLIR